MLDAVIAKRIAGIAKMAIAGAICGTVGSVVVKKKKTNFSTRTRRYGFGRAVVAVGLAKRVSAQTFKALVFVSTFLILESLERILNSVLRCLLVCGANVNVKKYAYRRGTPGRDQGGCCRRR